MPINSASIPALRVARAVKRRKRAEGGGIFDYSGVGEAMPEAYGAPETPKTIRRLTGTEPGGPRYQLWPEKMVRSGATLAGDVLSGRQAVLPPGLRREDYTDVPAPSGPTEDSTWLGGKMGWAPQAAQPNDPMMERAQDMAGLAGGQALSTGARGAVPAAERGLVAAADSQATGAPLAAVEHAPKFYSGLERAVEAIPQPRMTGEQWLGTLNNRGVKPEEMDWTGLRGFLAERGNQPVTKAQVAEHLGANKLELGEVEKGAAKSWDQLSAAEKDEWGRHYSDVGEHTSRNPNWDEVEHFYNRVKDEEAGATKFNDYQLPGATNYREKLLTLPRNKFTEADLPQGWRVEPTPHSSGDSFRIMAEGQEFPMGYGETRQSAIEQALAENKINPNAREWYSSSHWDEPNVLVHRRTNERDVNGQRSLHIEEIQSDLHQQGRKQGYRGAAKPLDETQVARAKELNLQAQALRDKGMSLDEVRDTDIGRELLKLREQHQAFENQDRLGMVPDVPFKKNWHELALKDALREAAEKGLNRLSWTPGEAQAARYDLSKHIERMKVYRSPEGGFSINAWPHGSENPESLARAIPLEKLSDYVGKDMAERIAKDADRITETKGKDYSGLDLKVGGEGMRGFYDKMIPDALNKIGKPHGVKVERGTTNADPATAARSAEEFHEIANANAINHQGVRKRYAPVHYMDIPQSLKDQVLKKGFSLFEDSAAIGAPLAAAQNDGDLVASLLAEQEARTKPKKSAIPMPERKAGGSVASPAMNIARNIKRAKGGKVHIGPIVGDTGGRADKVPMRVPNGAYVVPADIVSGLGEGNSGAGMLKLGQMFPESKPSLMRAMPSKDPVPVLCADGEFVVSPTSITKRWDDIDYGHRTLDAWVLHERKNLIATLKDLPGPAQD